MSTIVLTMLSLNVPLSQWRSFERDVASGSRSVSVWHGGKNTDKVAQAIFTQLSHDETVKLIAREYANFAPDLRMRFNTLCNDGNCSGNVRKGVQRLNELLNGKINRDPFAEVERVRDQHGRWKSKKVNQAVAGATRKYGGVK